MRTSPLGMRRVLRRAPTALLLSLALVTATAAACSDDGGDDTSPTTTSPATTEASDAGGDDGDETTTTDAADETTTTTEGTGTSEAGTVPGDAAAVLTVEQATAQLEALIASYRDAVAGAAAAQSLDERALAAFNDAFTGARARQELDGLREAGLEVLNPSPPTVSVSEVVLGEAVGGCAAGTVVVEGLAGLVTVPVDVIQPYYFRLVPAADGAAAPAWRLDFFNFSDNGVPLEAEAACS